MTDRVAKTMENLKKNKMDAYYCENSEEARSLVASLLQGCVTVSAGGSETLKQTGITDYITSDKFEYIDRFKQGITEDERRELFARIFLADAYLMSSNAITENGELYNVDGNSNRVSALLYGPKSVIIVAGVNKIVKNLGEAIMRVKCKAAPPNAVRQNKETPCSKLGRCAVINQNDLEFTQGCSCTDRMCCNFVVCAQQRHVGRIKVVLINEELGY
ncbi:MAG: lactate utilization protein [Acutalibacteraceae bacterium]